MSLENYFPLAESITVLFFPHAEVVIHDLKTGCVAAVYNNFSKRKVGDESGLDEIENCKELPNIFPVYLKSNWDGRKIKSTSITLRDQDGKAIGLFCINLDVTKWEEFHRILENWLHHAVHPQPTILFKDDWREKINSYVSNYLLKLGTSLKLLSKEKKKELVLALHNEGAFQAKNAPDYIADVLDISRGTIYNYMKGTSKNTKRKKLDNENLQKK